MNKAELYDRLKNFPVSDWLRVMQFKTLIKVKHIENIPIGHRFGRVIFNPKPVLTNGPEPYCYISEITIDQLKKEYTEMGMSKEGLKQFDLFELILVNLNPVENEEE